MDDAELIKQFIKTSQGKNGVDLLVCQIEWEGPYTPHSHWKKVEQFPTETPEEHIQQGIKKLLQDPEYFLICSDCSERNPVGWMTGDVCHRCAEQNHGIVY